MDGFGLSPALIWFLIALVLGGVELLTLTFFLLWPALAALIVALLTWIMPDMAIGWQIVAFAAFSVLLLIPGRKWVKNSSLVKNESIVNDRSASMVGRLGYIVSGKDGLYRVKVGDSEWGGRGDDALKVDDQIRVKSVDGIVLVIEAA